MDSGLPRFEEQKKTGLMKEERVKMMVNRNWLFPRISPVPSARVQRQIEGSATFFPTMACGGG